MRNKYSRTRKKRTYIDTASIECSTLFQLIAQWIASAHSCKKNDSAECLGEPTESQYHSRLAKTLTDLWQDV